MGVSSVVSLSSGFRLATLGNVAAALALSLFLAACNTADTLDIPRPASVASAFDPSKYAAIVVDARSGEALYESSANVGRYPASLTKMMTLFLLFEAIDQGRVSLATPIAVSAYAASRPPTKIGFKPGQTVMVEEAIRALIVKSANDVAVAVAEHLAGSESAFASQMTARARSLGMGGTVFRNASGLPDAGQRTTARDMAILGVQLRRRFPHHYGYFGARDFAYRGQTIRGHNKLIGSVRGVDGIKTGYIRASGFNVVTSVSDGGRQIVVVVLGGKSADSRNDHVEELIQRFLPRATRPSGGPGFAGTN